MSEVEVWAVCTSFPVCCLDLLVLLRTFIDLSS